MKINCVCSECGGKNLYIKAWVNINTLIMLDGTDEEETWCEDCNAKVNLVIKE